MITTITIVKIRDRLGRRTRGLLSKELFAALQNAADIEGLVVLDRRFVG
jgi:hypothetical protein